jgi:hypothetical protein
VLATSPGLNRGRRTAAAPTRARGALSRNPSSGAQVVSSARARLLQPKLQAPHSHSDGDETDADDRKWRQAVLFEKQRDSDMRNIMQRGLPRTRAAGTQPRAPALSLLPDSYFDASASSTNSESGTGEDRNERLHPAAVDEPPGLLQSGNAFIANDYCTEPEPLSEINASMTERPGFCSSSSSSVDPNQSINQPHADSARELLSSPHCAEKKQADGSVSEVLQASITPDLETQCSTDAHDFSRGPSPSFSDQQAPANWPATPEQALPCLKPCAKNTADTLNPGGTILMESKVPSAGARSTKYCNARSGCSGCPEKGICDGNNAIAELFRLAWALVQICWFGLCASTRAIVAFGVFAPASSMRAAAMFAAAVWATLVFSASFLLALRAGAQCSAPGI